MSFLSTYQALICTQMGHAAILKPKKNNITLDPWLVTLILFILNRNIHHCLISGQSENKWIYLAATVIVLCVLGVVVEILQLMNIYWRYFTNPDNYFQLASYIVTFIFIVILIVNGNDNWCSTPEQWQIRTFIIFLPWLNFIFILKDMPYTAIPINRIFSICVTFLTLIFLAMLLILTFGIPFYVVFEKVSCLD